MSSASRTFWHTAQFVTLGGFGLAAAGLILGPDAFAQFLWSGIIPLLPIVFMLHPTIWRNICPLATLGTGRSDAPPDRGPPLVVPGVVAFLILLPLRPSLFQLTGMATAALLIGVGLFAFWAGGRGHGKAGFCNRLCPILPIERLYGQAPLIEVSNARCTSCDLCAPRGCLDLNPVTAVAQVMGDTRHGLGWLRAPFGAFAAIFPGLILGFYMLPPSPSVALAYLTILGSGAVSWLIVFAICFLLRPGWRVSIVLLAGISAALHLWFSLPGVLGAWGLAPPALWLQLPGVAFAIGWTALALRGKPGRLVQMVG